MSEQRTASMVVIASGFLFGTTGTATILADTGASSLAVASARLVVGSLGLITLAWRAHGSAPLLELWRRRETWAMGLGVAGYMALFFAAVGVGGAAIASLVSISLSPFFAASFARMLGRPWPGKAWMASTVLAIGGVVLLGWPSTGAAGSHRLSGAMLAAGASASYGAYTAFGARFVQRDVRATDALAASFAVAALLLLPFLVVDAGWLGTWRGGALALWLGVATTTAAYRMFGFGLTHLAPGVVATLVLSEPVVATLLGVGVLGEPMPLRGWLGCAAIAGGLLLVARSASRRVAHA